MTNRHEQFLADAVRLSRENAETGQGGPFGAVVVRDGQEVVARAANRVTAENDPTAHAEICAIREACRALGTFTLAGCVLYSSCEPCPMCLAAAHWARLDAVYFAATRDDAARAGFDDAFLYQEMTLPLSERALPILHQTELRDEAVAVFDAWLRLPDRTPY